MSASPQHTSPALDENVEQVLTLDSIFYYRGDKPILQGTYLQIESGKIHGLLGINGSGKSTLLKIASGQLLPTSGSVTIDGERFTTANLNRRFAKIAYLPQKSMLPRDFQVKALIHAFPKPPRSLLEDPYISSFLSKKIGALSHGQRRYLEFRLVLNLDRKYILLDEPFSGIEPLLIDQMSQAIVDVARSGKGIIVTDHYYRDVLSFVDFIDVIVSGHCSCFENSADIKDQLQTLGYLGEN